MTSANPDDWSSADNPYAIAVSQSHMWRAVVQLALLRMRDKDDYRVGWSSRQLDAHTLVMALRQLLTAEQLEQAALEALGIDPAVGTALADARKQFEETLPGIKDMRDALMHFDEHSRGLGMYGPQAERRKAGDDLRDIARDFWRFGYDPATGIISFGPYTIDIEVAERAANKLCREIYAAAHEVDVKNTAELRATIIEALTSADIHFNTNDALLRVSPGTDVRIWLSLDLHADAVEQERRDLAERIIGAVSTAGLRLESTNPAVGLDSVERLVHGEALWVEADTREAVELDTGPVVEVISPEQFTRCAELAVDKLKEAERCAETESFQAACVMVGAAVESALAAHICVFQSEVRAANLWRKRRNRKTNIEEDKPLFDWTLEDLIQVAVGMKWLQTAGGEVSAADPVDKLAGEVGDAVRFIQEVRNLVVHPGKYVRGEYWPTIRRDEYEVVYGIARMVLDHLEAELEKI